MSETHCVIIPSYNAGPLLHETVQRALQFWHPVVVVIDGSTDGSELPVKELASRDHALHVLHLERNQGKGAAVLEAFLYVQTMGYTHAAVFDSDGQHEAADLPKFLELSREYPQAMVLGVPIFGNEAPMERVKGRLIANWWTNCETLWGGIVDSLFGFRVYPIAESIKVLQSISGGRRFDFDTQLVVRLYWAGLVPLNMKTSVRYLSKDAGGVSHYRYLRDNALLGVAHAVLLVRALTLLPRLIRFRRRDPLRVV